MSYIKTIIDWNGLADAVTTDILTRDHIPAGDTHDFLEVCETMRAGIWRHTQDQIHSLDTSARRELCEIIEKHAGSEFWSAIGARIYC